MNKTGKEDFIRTIVNRREIELNSAGTKNRRTLGVAVSYWKSIGGLSWDCGGGGVGQSC